MPNPDDKAEGGEITILCVPDTVDANDFFVFSNCMDLASSRFNGGIVRIDFVVIWTEENYSGNTRAVIHSGLNCLDRPFLVEIDRFCAMLTYSISVEER